ncbi:MULTISPECIES: MHYT domain-containing protein [Legionella]|uniref:histidine kinase n=1 Tax=Legionella drozanskii LLAP-1 TaxID=1212489 RepID=A0A0W0SVJ8_9GAMM|nr:MULTISPECIES: MHYT domain-containing protein [Legionella]KTC87431.1 sensory box histidine kinase/response regulator [Legionella drozanskii LLAP-1]PJE17505.1 MAG: histidine kinase [Legionella sp.]
MSFLQDWFQLEPIPGNKLEGYYDLSLVILSYIVAVLASYVALTLVSRLREEKNKHAAKYWLVGGAFTMGAGIWSMHFIGMLAFVLPMPMEYELIWTGASLFMAMLASGFALFILQKKNYSSLHLAFGGFLIGLAISTMHYMGMEAMKNHVIIHYLPSLFFLSIFIGIVAAEVALWLALESDRFAAQKQVYFKMVSALIMGLAICGMHYTGMVASIFTPSPTHLMPDQNQVIQPNYLAFFIAGVSALIISLALIVSSYYKKMIDAVQNEKEFLNAMLDNLEDGIIACNEKGEVTVLNNAIQKNFSIDKSLLNVEKMYKYYQLSTPDHKPLPKDQYPLRRVFNGEIIQRLPMIVKFKNDETIDVIIDGQPIINKEGRSLGAVIVTHDITELKRAEKLKNEFVSIVSHELRTPLTSIRGSLGLLTSGYMGGFTEKAQKLLEIANNNCERLLLLINDILDIEKIEAGKMEFQLKNMYLMDMINEAVDANKMYAEKYSISFQIIQPQERLTVSVDTGRLMQVLANLLSNACKFSLPNAIVTIEVKKLEEAARVSVIDKGAGIPLEFQPRIFQKFSQADSSDTRGKGGTGLGLNISKSIIEKMGGTLNFQSEPNQGSTFYFDLPLVASSPESEVFHFHEGATSTKRLLICEDDQDQADYLKALLESAGFNVDIAFTARQAKEKLGHQEYQAMLLDLILPDQDGISLIRELRVDQKTRDLPIIVLSIISQTGKILLNGDAVSVIDWVDKPVDLKRLLQVINKLKPQGTDHLPIILHVEDNEDTQHVVGVLLEEHAKLYTATSLGQAKKMLAQRNYDLIILDLLLPDGNGVDILPLLAQYKTPVLVFSDMQLSNQYAQYVSQALVKSNSNNEKLLSTIMNLI